MNRVRVFLSSPGDVVDERGIALSVIDDLAYEPELAGRLTVEALSWDDLGRGRPVFATETPQASLNRGKRRPADCDIAVVLFWSRMGTPLPYPEYQKPDGSPYASGTEWEFYDALDGHARMGRPMVLLYRRQPMRGLDATSPKFDDDLAQQRKVLRFFDALRDPEGALRVGTNTYASPEELRQLLRRDLRFAFAQLADEQSDVSDGAPPAAWVGSPFPGLRPFTPRDAPIFFGRGRNSDTVVERLSSSRFVAVVGASGSGKSSLVGAGVIPRLAVLAVSGVQAWWLPDFDPSTNRWSGLRFTPGGAGTDPFVALAQQLAAATGGEVGSVADVLRTRPEALQSLVATASASVAPAPAPVEALLFVDQFEELFTIAAAEHVDAFVRLLVAATMAPNVRTVLTVRSDFYPRCLEEPALAGLLEFGHVPLPRPSETLSEMIERPAFRAGLRFEEGLVDRILRDAGQGLASLPLLAYTLDELYRASGPTGELSHAAYGAVGGLHGAIGARAETVFESLPARAQQRFPAVFGHLVEVEESGRVNRRRAELDEAAPDALSSQLVDAFTSAGLLVTESAMSAGAAPILSVAHEALFESWPRLHGWIDDVRDDLGLVRTALAAAQQWAREGSPETHLWPHERLAPVVAAVRRLNAELDDDTQAFLEGEHRRLLKRLCSGETARHQKQVIADRLAVIGDAAVPELAEALADPDPIVRALVATTMARIGEGARAHLADVITRGSPEARMAAIAAAVEAADHQLVPAISLAIAHADVRVRSLARGALSALGGEGAVDALGRDLLHGPFDDRWEAAGAVAALGASAVPALAAAMTNRHRTVRAAARRAANAAGAALVPGAAPLLGAPDARTRLGAARLLAAVGRPAVEALRVSRRSEDNEVRALAVSALAEMGDVRCLEDLVDAATDNSVDVRRAAVIGLEPIADATIAPSLIDLLDDVDAIVRRVAAETLRSLGSSVAPTLAGRLTTRDSRSVRLQRIRHFRQIRGPVVEAFAAVAVMEHDESVRRQLVGAISELEVEGVPSLTHLAAKGPADVADEAAAALAALGSAAADALVELARSTDPAIRRRAVPGLAATSDERALPILSECLRDPDERIRQLAAIALARFEEAGLPILTRALADPAVEVRQAASTGLEACGGVAAPSLLAMLASGGFDVPLVVRTLQSIGTSTALLALAAHPQ